MLASRFAPLTSPDLEPFLFGCAHLQVLHGQLRSVPLNDSDVVSELVISDEVVTVTVYLVKGLDDVDGINAGGDECATDLVALETAELGALLLEDLPQRLALIVVEHVLLDGSLGVVTICFIPLGIWPVLIEISIFTLFDRCLWPSAAYAHIHSNLFFFLY